MSYVYFVSYSAPKTKGFGYTETTLNKKITELSILEEIAQVIKDEIGTDVAILFYQLLRTE